MTLDTETEEVVQYDPSKHGLPLWMLGEEGEEGGAAPPSKTPRTSAVTPREPGAPAPKPVSVDPDSDPAQRKQLTKAPVETARKLWSQRVEKEGQPEEEPKDKRPPPVRKITLAEDFTS